MGKKVLTIDDSQTVRTIIAKHLAQFSVSMLEAENGEDGVARAREGLPDLILLDYNMPVMDGYHTLIELRTDPNLKSIPVVMVTTETSKETVVKLLKLGLNDYIAKPFTRELLLKKINPILKLYAGDEIPEAPAKPAAPGRENAAPAPVKANAKPMVLAIDDKTSILNLVSEYLGEHFQLTTVESGKAALKAMEYKSFDYIFLDLSLPDMLWQDFLKTYLNDMSNGASEKKIIAMTLRSAQTDIHHASEAGIQAFLYKPFTRADISSSIDQAIVCQNESPARKLRYLIANGKTRILECPAEKSSKFKLYAELLTTDIVREIDMMVDEGLKLLIISVSEGFLTQNKVCADFISLIKHVNKLPLTIRLVADSISSRNALKQFSETANLPTDVSIEGALNSIA